MWESLFGSALTPAIQAGVGEAAVGAVAPALTDTALTAGVDGALAGLGLNSLGQSTAGLGLDQAVLGSGLNGGLFQTLGQLPTQFTNAGIGEASNFATGAGLNPANIGSGMFGDWQNALLSDQAKNIADIGFKGYGAFKQGQALDNANNIQQRQLAMSEDAYNRDKSADERRQKLVF